MQNPKNNFLSKLQAFLNTIESYLAAFSLLLMLILSLTQIVARNFFDTGFPVADTLSRHLVLYVMFFGAVLAVDAHRHIKIDFVDAWLSDTWSNNLFRPLHAIGAVLCGTLCYAAARFWFDEWEYVANGEEWIVLVNLILPIGFLLLSFHFLLATIAGPAQQDPKI